MGIITPDLGRRHRQSRFNPLRQLTPARLTNALDAFESGYLRQAALIWELIEDRDDTVKIAVPKRRKAVSRRPWEIIKIADTPKARRDAEALEYFYNNLTATNAIDLNVRGGFRILVNQMMHAEFYQYAAHEIIWQPRRVGGRQLLTAEFRYVPLYFFENTTGRLRYTGPEGLLTGQDLEDDGWMITTGDGIHKAISICRTLKQLSLQDWVNYSEKFGVPGIHGKTPAAKGSAEWEDFVNALDAFANDWITASGQGTEIDLIEVGKTSDAPFAPMVERMDRRITALCRGADLGTLSSQDGAGASLQGDETDILLEDDCDNISETLNTYVDRFVLRWLNGRDHEPLAYIQLQPPVQTDTKMDIEVDRFLLDHGGSLEADKVYERYGRPLPEDMQDFRLSKNAQAEPNVAPQPAPAGLPGTATPTGTPSDSATAPAAPEAEATDAPDAPAANDDTAVEPVADTLGVPSSWLAPVRDLLAGLEAKAKDQGVTDTELAGALEAAARKIPELFGGMDATDLADVLEVAYGRSVLRGIQSSINKETQKT